jgi:hypothetical protein
MLRRRSQNTNVKLRALAEQLVSDYRTLSNGEALPHRSVYDEKLMTVEELSSLKGRGCVKGSSRWCFRRSRPLCEQRRVRAVGQRRSARSVARTDGLDRGPARRRLGAAGERCVNSVVVRGLQCDVYGLGPGQCLGCRSSLRPSSSGMERCAGNTRGQSKPRPRRIFGGQTITRPRACCVRDAHAAAGWWARARMCPSRSP